MHELNSYILSAANNYVKCIIWFHTIFPITSNELIMLIKQIGQSQSIILRRVYSRGSPDEWLCIGISFGRDRTQRFCVAQFNLFSLCIATNCFYILPTLRCYAYFVQFVCLWKMFCTSINSKSRNVGTNFLPPAPNICSTSNQIKWNLLLSYTPTNDVWQNMNWDYNFGNFSVLTRSSP